MHEEFLTSPGHEGQLRYFAAQQATAVAVAISDQITVWDGSAFVATTDDLSIDRLPAATRDAGVDYMRRLLFSMAADEESGLTYGRVNKFLTLLSRVMDERSVYPAVTPDGLGGISFEWSTEGWLVELDIDSAGEYALVSRLGGAPEAELTVTTGRVSVLPVPTLRQMVQQFTSFVESKNANWRSLF